MSSPSRIRTLLLPCPRGAVPVLSDTPSLTLFPGCDYYESRWPACCANSSDMIVAAMFTSTFKVAIDDNRKGTYRLKGGSKVAEGPTVIVEKSPDCAGNAWWVEEWAGR